MTDLSEMDDTDPPRPGREPHPPDQGWFLPAATSTLNPSDEKLDPQQWKERLGPRSAGPRCGPKGTTGNDVKVRAAWPGCCWLPRARTQKGDCAVFGWKGDLRTPWLHGRLDRDVGRKSNWIGTGAKAEVSSEWI